MKRTALATLVVATIAGGLTFGFGGGAQAGDPEPHPACDGHLYTYPGDGDEDFVIPPVPVDGYHWTWASVKAGSENQGLGHDAPIAVVPGQVVTHSSGKDISHVDICKVSNSTTTTTSSTTTSTTLPPPDPCSWPAVKTNEAQCITYEVESICGSVSGFASGSITNKPTWTYGVWFSTDLPTGPADGTPGGISFPEDSGDANVFYWVAGTENDVLRGVPTWDDPDQQSVNTDCIPPQPEPYSETTWDELGEPECGVTEQTQTGTIHNYAYFLNAETQQWELVEVSTFPTSRVVPVENPTQCPVPDAEVVCTSSGPDYVAWQITNTGEVAITSPLSLAPGESGVDESLKNEQGEVTIIVEFADGSSGEFTGSGEGCVFTPPVTTAPPATTNPPATTDPPVTDPPPTSVSPSPPSVTDPPSPTTTAVPSPGQPVSPPFVGASLPETR